MMVDSNDDNGTPKPEAAELAVEQRCAAIGQLIHQLHDVLHSCAGFEVQQANEMMNVKPRLVGSKPVPIPTGNFILTIKVKMPPKVTA